MLHQMQSMTCCCSFYLNAGCNPPKVVTNFESLISNCPMFTSLGNPERKSGLSEGPMLIHAFRPAVLLRLVLDCILDLEKEAEQMKLGAPLQAWGVQ